MRDLSDLQDKGGVAALYSVCREQPRQSQPSQRRRGREGRPLGKIADSRIGTRKVERETRICASKNDGDMRKGTGATLENILLAKSWKFELQNK